MVAVACDRVGTTSACAENTLAGFPLLPEKWNYLRVRGEYSGGELAAEAVLELPPRARRIRTLKMPKVNKIGTTSACAENTPAFSGSQAP